MFRKILGSLLSVFIFISLSFASKTYLIDTPTLDILSCDSYDMGFRFFSNGNVLSKIDFGVFKFLNVGLSLESGRIIGYDHAKIAIPALQVKFRIYDGNMTLPGIVVGYDGQGYFFNSGSDDKYLQRGKGVYIVAGREFLIEGLMLNIGININGFSKPETHGFVNLLCPIYNEMTYFMMEYDNISYFPKLSLEAARFNFGLKFSLTEYIDVDFIVRDCFAKGDNRFPCERVFKVICSSKF
ncbi:MAG: hypothetical protein LBN19_02890 [Endomicrobium sp.]|jgi:hypothetical protein|nr:hypothetical protein [Endomicrobium sp.]